MRLLLVEDEPDLGRAIKRTLTQEAYIVDWVQSGDEALAYLEHDLSLYTLGIFDWMVPGRSGIELCQWLRSRRVSGEQSQHHSLPVLILTAKDQIEDRIMGLDAGADDYLVKPFSMGELLARLRALRRRSPDIKSPQITIGPLTLDCDRRIALFDAGQPSEQTIELAQKEFQLLQYLMEHPNQILTRDQVLNRLWEIGAEPNSNVVAAQMRLLRKRLAPYQCDYLVETVYGMGYRFKAE
ncbi:MAG: two-component system response regulator RppA [Leptolyngbyaceae bacterium]|nr:two-component system response regulator RppA [Leptolyngbyaceae bacterium]